MGKSLNEIAQDLKASTKKVQLIYAFNGTGKTRLSREFKELLAAGIDTGDDDDAETSELSSKNILYYNAFTEDLFYWDNDLNGDEDRKLKIHPNAFTKWVLEEQGQDQNIVQHFQNLTGSKVTPEFGVDFSTVSFSMPNGEAEQLQNLKISKGEESNFIWSVFYTLLDLIVDVLNVPEPEDRETQQFNQLKYVFIDDPVSSLDENHLIQLAVNLGRLIKSSESDLKFIVSTHNPLFYNVLYNEVKAKNGYILSKFDDGTFELEEKKGDSNKSLSYHLHIKKLIEQAIDSNSVQRYHFALLRNLYEKTAGFLGYDKWSDLLPGDQKAYATRIMNFYPHNTLPNEQIAEPTGPEKEMVSLLLGNLNQFGYLQQEAQND